jgi:hypothetical protein
VGQVKPDLRETEADDEGQQLIEENVGAIADENEKQAAHQRRQAGQAEYLPQFTQPGDSFFVA